MKNLDLYQILHNLKEYCKKFFKICHLIPHPFCRDENCVLIGWGFYIRKDVRESNNNDITGVHIKRFYCKTCKKTLSFLPPFLLPYKRYTASVVEESFEMWIRGEKESKICNYFGIKDERTLRRWFNFVKGKANSIIQKAKNFLSRKFFHISESELFKSRNNFEIKKKGISKLFILLSNLSTLFRKRELMTRVPYYYILVFKPP